MYEWEEPGEYDSGEVYRTDRELDQMDTDLLRCGGGEVLVAQLQVAYKAPFDTTTELCVLRPGSREWEFKEAVPIVHHEGGGRHDLGRWQELNAAIPAGNRFLCWVSYDFSTFLVCDMAEEENPKLRYVPLPVKAVPPKENEWGDDDEHEEQISWMYYHSIGATPPPVGMKTDGIFSVPSCSVFYIFPSVFVFTRFCFRICGSRKWCFPSVSE
jgi:hypothetical protein